jgi:hypothetical protein
MATPKLEHIGNGPYTVRWAGATVEFDVLKKAENPDGRSHAIVRVRLGKRRAIYTVTKES